MEYTHQISVRVLDATSVKWDEGSGLHGISFHLVDEKGSVNITFGNQKQKTKIVENAKLPKFDETLLFYTKSVPSSGNY